MPETRWQLIEPYVPPDLTGRTVLDAGGNAGFFAVQMKLRGAKRCVLVDPFIEFARQAEFIAREFGVDLDIITEDLHTYCLSTDERFDYVLFLGVFYHLKYPVLVLDCLAEMTKRRMFFQSHLIGSETNPYLDQANYTRGIDDDILQRPSFPHLVFLEKLYNLDPTNWWIPNYAAMESLLRSAGMKVIARPHAQLLIAEPEEYFGKVKCKGMFFPRYGKRGTGIPHREPVDAVNAGKRPAINHGGVINAANGSAELAPGVLATVFGENLAPGSEAASSGAPLPDRLSGVKVLLNDAPAPMLFVSTTQINFVVPWEVKNLTQLSVRILTRAGVSEPEMVKLVPVSPGIFVVGSGRQGAIFDAETGELAATTSVSDRPAKRAARGAALVIECAGLGSVSNPPMTGVPAPDMHSSETVATPVVTIGGLPAKVSFSRLAPRRAGIYQVGIEVPQDAPQGETIPVVLSVEGIAANTVTIAVE